MLKILQQISKNKSKNAQYSAINSQSALEVYMEPTDFAQHPNTRLYILRIPRETFNVGYEHLEFGHLDMARYTSA